jgi:beta-lactam-binding protein with PASTA domain
MGPSGTRDTLATMSNRAPRRPPPAAARWRCGAVDGRVAVLLALFVVLAAVTAWVGSRYLVSAEVRLPLVEGLSYEQAAGRLRSLGLDPHAYPEIDARAMPNEVLSQSPAAGQLVRPGRRVALGVNALAEVRVAPNLVGLSEADAVTRARVVGVVVERVQYVAADQPTGTVVRQEPAAGSALSSSQTLLVAVSRGSAAAPIPLPDVRGLTIEAAEAELTRLGIRQIDKVPAALSFDRPFTVTDQRPAPGSEVLPATPITLVYALEGTRVVRVPALEGMPMWRAQLALRAAQLEVGPVRRIDDPSLPAGVVEARPAGYTVAGSAIALTVNGAAQPGDPDAVSDVDLVADPWSVPASVEPAVPPLAAGLEAAHVPDPGTSQIQDDGSRVIPFRFEPATVGVASLMREPYRLRLVVADADGERTVFDRELAAGEALAVPVRVVGDEPLLQTFLNGSFFQAWRP